MACREKNKHENEDAILIYGLPSSLKNSVLASFPDGCIGKVIQDSDGLKIWFESEDFVRKSLLRRTFEISGFSFKVYPMVTNLTVRGIGSFASDLDIENAMKFYGCVIDLYPLKRIMTNTTSVRNSFIGGYRIILDIPEVFANIDLKPVKLPDTDFTFEVLYFCRLCRRSGHKQFQCRNPKDFQEYSRDSASNEGVPGESIISKSTMYPNTSEDRKTNMCSNPPLSQKTASDMMNAKTESGDDDGKNNKINLREKETSKKLSADLGRPKPKHGVETPVKRDYVDGRREHDWDNTSGENNLKNNPHKTFQSVSSLQQASKSHKPDLSLSKSKYHNSTYVERGSVSEKSHTVDLRIVKEENSSNEQFGFENTFAWKKSSANLVDSKSLQDWENTSGNTNLKNNPHKTFQCVSSLQQASKSHKPDPSFAKSKYHNSTYVERCSVYEKNQSVDIRIVKEENCSNEQFGFENISAWKKPSANLVDSKSLKDWENTSEETDLKNNPHNMFQFGSCVQQTSKSHKPDPSLSQSKYHNSTCVERGSVLEKSRNDDLRIVKEENSSNEQFGFKNESISKKSSANLLRIKSLEEISVICLDSENQSGESEVPIPNKLGNEGTSPPNTSTKPTNEKPLSVHSGVLTRDADLSASKKQLKEAGSVDPENITENDVRQLRKIFKFNRSSNRETLGADEREMHQWEKQFLRKVERLVDIQKKSQMHSHQEKSRGGQRASDVPKRQFRRQQKITLSKGVRRAIFKTPGELEPDMLCNFLNQVRGRKKILEIASIFTSDVAALARQLLDIQRTYFTRIRIRGYKEDRDINYIKTLRQRLSRQANH